MKESGKESWFEVPATFYSAKDKDMNRRDFLKTASAVTLLGLTNSFAKAERKPSKRPNIIYIMTDDQSPFPIEKQKASQSRPFGFNGDRHVYTPVIDDLAKNGMVFTRAYVSSSVCSPSRYSTLTGRFAGRCQGPHFMREHPQGTMTRVENNTELEENRPNLARLLQRVGYRTGFLGKCHIIDHNLLGPARKDNRDNSGLMSYDKAADPKDPEVTKAMAHNHNFWVKRIKEFGFDYVNSVYAANLRELFIDAANVHNVEWKNKAALDFIDQSGDEPFFLYYSETIPHGPAPWIKRNGNYNFGKATLYESGVKVPLVMYWPEGIKPGSIYNELVQNIDYAPTFLDLARVEIDASMEIDGISLSKVLKGDTKPVHDYLFFELGYARGVMTKDSKYIAVRYDQKTEQKIAKGIKFNGWEGRKLDFPYYVRNQHLGYHSGIYNENYFDKDQLYDLKNDPDEKNNIYDSNTGKAEEMKQKLVEYLRSFPARPYGEMVRSSN